MRFCTNCGKELADDVAFCTECGTPVPSAEQPPVTPIVQVAEPTVQEPQPTVQQSQSTVQQSQPTIQEPQPNVQQSQQYVQRPQPNVQQSQSYAPQGSANAEVKPTGGKYGVLSTGAFWGVMLLFAIPIIGWIACIVMAFASKNENLKHFSRAVLIWALIGIVLCAVLYLIFMWAGNSLGNYMNNGSLDQYGEMFDIMEQLQGGAFSDMPDMSGFY